MRNDLSLTRWNPLSDNQLEQKFLQIRLSNLALFRIVTLVIIFSLMTPQIVYSEESSVDYDTTHVRDVQPVKKSTGEILADIPGEILKYPLYIFEFVSRTIVMNPRDTTALSLIQRKGEKAPYNPVVGLSSRSGLKLGIEY